MLERIRQCNLFTDWGHDLTRKEILFLIEQAEKVEWLEKRVEKLELFVNDVVSKKEEMEEIFSQAENLL